MSQLDFHIPIAYLKGIGPSRAELLASELGIRKIEALFSLFPFRYIDKTRFYKVRELQQNSSEVQLVGKISKIRTVKQKRGSRLTATFADATGEMELVWFRGAKWIKDSLKVDAPYVIFGKANFYNGTYSMPHPEMELLSSYEKSVQTALQPVYPSTEKLANKGVSQKVVSNIMRNLFKTYYHAIPETLSSDLMENYNLLPKNEALLHAHFPQKPRTACKGSISIEIRRVFLYSIAIVAKKNNASSKDQRLSFCLYWGIFY